MAITPAQFRARFPEFKNQGDVGVQAVLDEAYRRVGENGWDELRDDGAQYLAAHLISSSVLAEPSAKAIRSADGKTTYLREFERLQAEVRIFGTSLNAAPSVPEAGY